MNTRLLVCVAALFGQSMSWGAVTTIHSFVVGTDGTIPEGELLAADGWLYGCASAGGTNNCGTVFKLSTNGSSSTVIKTFAGTNGYTPEPLGGLILSGDTLYGTTASGTGGASRGTVFKVNTDGSGFQTLYAFTLGRTPQAGLMLVGSTLYGTTYYGGPLDDGVLFKIDASGSGYTELKYFTNTLNADGVNPIGSLATDGSFIYGGTAHGGAHAAGVIYKTDGAGGSYSVLHSFDGVEGGATPGHGVILAGTTLYGVAGGGILLPGIGSGRGGIVFKVNTDGSGYTILHSFADKPDGKTPAGKLQLVGDTLYGITSAGGTNGAGFGTLFRIGTNGSGYAILHHFTNSVPGPRSPLTGVTASDGRLYGTSFYGGSNDASTVYTLAIPPVAIPPLLQITNANQQPIVFWLDDGGNWTLQRIADLSSTNWSDTGLNWTNGLDIGLAVTNPAALPSEFFRLH